MNTNKLRKVLTLRDLVLFGVGGTVGAGIFVSIGVGAVQAGPALFLSFFLASLACTISGLCFCEMASRVPTSGSSYSYTLFVLGEFPAFLIGSVLVLDSIISAAACARAWSSYMVIVLPFLPSFLSNVVLIPHILSISLLSALICAVLGIVLFFGIKETTTFNNISTCLNIMVLSVFVFGGIPLAQSANWSPFAPNGVEGVVRGAGRIFFAYLGFDVVNCLAEETAQDGISSSSAKRMVPTAILSTIVISTFVYVLVAISFVGLVPFGDINTSSPLSSAFAYRGFSSLAYIVGIGAVGNTMTSVLSNFLVQPRIVLRMAADGLLPARLAEIDHRGVPRMALFVSVAASTFTALLIDFETLADMVSVASLISLSTVCVCSVIARLRDTPAMDRLETADNVEEVTALSPGKSNSQRSFGLFFPILSTYLLLCVVTAAYLLHATEIGLAGTILLALTTVGWLSACVSFSKNEKQFPNPDFFLVPLSPGLPLIGVFVNSYLLFGLPPLALVRALGVFTLASVYYWFQFKRNGMTEKIETS